MSEYFKKGALRAMSEDEREAILNGKLISLAKNLIYFQNFK